MIFSALVHAYALFPSNSRIAEQNHGMFRDSLRSFESILYAKMKMCHLINIHYHQKEARRKAVAKRQIESDNGRSRQALKHERSKAEQVVMIGRHLVESGQKYTVKELAKIPKAFMKDTTIRRIHRRGMLHDDSTCSVEVQGRR